jgi:uncharacterized protein YndB with AHSA1/START domain
MEKPAPSIPATGTERPALTLRRHYPVACEKVWRAWTEPQALKAWFGPEEIIEVPVAEIDLRVGGQFRVRMHAADGETHEVSGTYLEVVPNRKLVFSWAWRSTPERASRVTVRIEPDGAGCELVLLHEQFFDEAARDGHRHGWTGALVKLEGWLGGK